MGLGKIVTLNALKPVLHRIPVWFQAAIDDYNATLSDAQKIRQGKRHVGQWVQREALAQMREDGEVVGNFCPVENAQLEGMLFEGEPCNISLLLNKVRMYLGNIMTARTRSLRESESLNGMLAFNGIVTHPVVAFWEMVTPYNPLCPAIKRVGIGEEWGFGFGWAHTLWTNEGGMNAGVFDDGQPPLIPMPEVRLRKPDPNRDQTRRVGTKEEERQQQEKKRKMDGDSGKDASGRA
jgi:hypothetical protein